MVVTLKFPAGMCSKVEDAVDGSSFHYGIVAGQRPFTQIEVMLSDDALDSLKSCLKSNGLADVCEIILKR